MGIVDVVIISGFLTLWLGLFNKKQQNSSGSKCKNCSFCAGDKCEK